MLKPNNSYEYYLWWEIGPILPFAIFIAVAFPVILSANFATWFTTLECVIKCREWFQKRDCQWVRNFTTWFKTRKGCFILKNLQKFKNQYEKRRNKLMKSLAKTFFGPPLGVFSYEKKQDPETDRLEIPEINQNCETDQDPERDHNSEADQDPERDHNPEAGQDREDSKEHVYLNGTEVPQCVLNYMGFYVMITIVLIGTVFWEIFLVLESYSCDAKLDCFVTNSTVNNLPITECSLYEDDSESFVICYQFVFRFGTGIATSGGMIAALKVLTKLVSGFFLDCYYTSKCCSKCCSKCSKCCGKCCGKRCGKQPGPKCRIRFHLGFNIISLGGIYLTIVVMNYILIKNSYEVFPSEILRGIWVAFTLLALSWIPWYHFVTSKSKETTEGKGKCSNNAHQYRSISVNKTKSNPACFISARDSGTTICAYILLLFYTCADFFALWLVSYKMRRGYEAIN